MKLPTHTKLSYHHLTTKEQKGFKIQVKDHFEGVRDSLEIGTIDVNKGDTVKIKTPGGGGYGDPLT